MMKLGVLARSVVRGRIPLYGIPWECWSLGVDVPGVESHGIPVLPWECWGLGVDVPVPL